MLSALNEEFEEIMILKSNTIKDQPTNLLSGVATRVYQNKYIIMHNFKSHQYIYFQPACRIHNISINKLSDFDIHDKTQYIIIKYIQHWWQNLGHSVEEKCGSWHNAGSRRKRVSQACVSKSLHWPKHLSAASRTKNSVYSTFYSIINN